MLNFRNFFYLKKKLQGQLIPDEPKDLSTDADGWFILSVLDLPFFVNFFLSRKLAPWSVTK
jgi:hypothetical protein